MFSKSDGSGTTQFAWDFENRLTQVITPASGSVTYKYDALGRRIQRTPSTGVSTNFIYDDQDVVKDINIDGSTVEYLDGPGIDNKIRQKGSTSSTTYYFAQDHLGSTTALTGTTGKLVERTTYDAYGNSAGSTRTRYGFTGRERDSLAGLMYYRARIYDPQLGRFISEDPIGFSGGDINFYGYVKNRPLTSRDPSGLFPIPIPFKPYPPFPDIWLHFEGGGGGQVIWGLNGSVGLIGNLKTGEICAYATVCGRFGFGVIVDAGFKFGGAIFGAHCGKNVGGWQGGVVGELSSPEGGGSVGIGYGGGFGGNIGIGPNIGLGFSVSGEVCYQFIIKCWNTPCECK